MKKFILSVLFAGTLFGQEKPVEPTQPTEQERLQLFQLQRDWLQAQIRLKDLAADLDAKALEIANKYKCTQWNADFTCIVKSTDPSKDKEK